MTACHFNIFIVFTVYLSFNFHPSHGFKVIQPQFQTINPDGSAVITCEHTVNVSSVEDARLNSISQADTSKRSLLCQKGKKECKNIAMHPENPNKWLFILLNLGPENMTMSYECEFTVRKGHLDYTMKGIPTRLRSGQKETEKDCISPPPPPPPPPSQHYQLIWTLTGLLALIFLYSCAISFVYVRLRMTNNKREPENCTYVEMRKAPLPTDLSFNSFCG
ncbi:uncharacterized protein LOC120801149 isoform X2 [Xiphias gladius]|uniref:uncharacterized protein LOC120801149 isoform X2 n=1 Tax=Xiphias gladius TaxID=8245 RepID=UPI001A99146F|nr:uncharacterized protein LOC120801149 isoform X2 [Xiphias gladius]